MSNIFLESLNYHLQAGGKAANLHRLQAAGFKIPPFVVLAPTSRANENWNALIASFQQESCDWPTTQYAVRSSALDEDGEEHSFAGQYDTVLGVKTDQLPDAIEQVWQSINSAHLLAYQHSNHTKIDIGKPAVMIQAMITADISGVCFSQDPNCNTDNRIINAVAGLGSSLVDGAVDASHFELDDLGNVHRQLAAQQTIRSLSKTGVKKTDYNLSVDLSDAQVKSIASLAQQCADFFGCPQDIEWAIENGKLWLLQSRPITSIHEKGDIILWDNSNIAESYCGVTTPMTFSFARYVYEGVYRQFLSILNVSEQDIKSANQPLKAMLGLHSGRIYYNMNSWYQLLALLPGFRFNRVFMEQMMGVKEGLPYDIAKQLNTTSRWGKIKDGFHLVRSVSHLLWLNGKLPTTIDRFYTRFNDVLRLNSTTEQMTGQQALHAYRNLERELLPNWDAPLINDFFAMINVGLLAKLCESWLKDPSLHSQLLAVDSDIISAEPAARMAELAMLAQNDSPLLKALNRGNMTKVKAVLTVSNARRTDFDLKLTSYLESFSDRCLEELKLESFTLIDNPTPLLKAIAAQAQNRKQTSQRQELDIDPLLKPLSWLKRGIFNWVLRHARTSVINRENLRFERTRLFGQVRKLILVMATDLKKQNRIEQIRDVFYLELHELIGIFEGTSTTEDLRSLIQNRKTSFQAYNTNQIPDRFITTGPVYSSKREAKQPMIQSGDSLKGTGACPGVVTGRVRYVTDPHNANMQPGDILVAQQTDPGWVMLFPLAAGLLVERGSLLSHSAIVARELNIPAVVSIPNLMQRIKDGDWVQLNGRTGEVLIIEPLPQYYQDAAIPEAVSHV